MECRLGVRADCADTEMSSLVTGRGCMDLLRVLLFPGCM